MRVVVDTNVLVSALISDAHAPYQLMQAWLDGRYRLVTSREQIEEITQVTRYPSVRSYIHAGEAGWLVNQIRSGAELVARISKVDISPDRGDNFLFGIAQAGDADYLVSGDKRHVLCIPAWGKTRTVTASQLIRILHLQAKHP